MRTLTAAFLFLALSACIVEAPTAEGTKATKPRPPPAPPRAFPVAANFDDRLELTNVVIAPGAAVSGDVVRVQANFKVLAPLEADYMIFVHVEDVDGKVDRLNVDHAPARGASRSSTWKPGDVIRDEFEINIPPGFPVRAMNLVMGLWDPKTDARLPLKNTDQVRNDGANRIFAAQFPVAQP